ncbi:TonB-dependent receptor plug domain-containing protein [Coraliomargarita akajimensis]|uniref:TonB-dependent receptor n=1 Tax=Coraliomargarita akajimensis (strain DSM 45221 / IAM 15411 / JCM 23193 / KCTC 12865 / 04OKA010-24) TaxID=583355 RepID=D5ENK3_CORAD|nr:TonB-dependent receptor [Coraliomargarita akajimensis]ADE55479.1 TonB-dependent receptor [Coraliomargarita akajimensis DSM 45221]
MKTLAVHPLTFGRFFGILSLSLLSIGTALSGASEAVVELEDFTVVSTATRTERVITEVPIKTELLGGEEFGIAAKYDLGQAIELLNGARSENNCQNCGTAEIQLLGLPGKYNQILIDGQPLFTGAAGVYGIDQVPTLFVERIEVVKGGGSALYGPGAVAGVINLIPEEPFESHIHSSLDYFSIDGSSAYNGQFAGFYVDDARPLKVSVYAQYAEQDPYDADGDGFTELVDRENLAVGTYLWYDLTDRTRLRVNYQYINEARRGGGTTVDGPEYEAELAEALQTDYHWATARLEQRVSSDFDFALSASMVYFERDSYYGGNFGDPLPPVYDPSNPDDPRNFYGELGSFTYYLDAQFNYYLGDIFWGEHTLSWGIQYEDEWVEEDNVNYLGDFLFEINDSEYDNIGLYVQDQWQVTQQLEFVPGLRFDKASTLDDAVWSPRVAARYTVTNEWTLRGNLSSGFLAPRVFDEDLHITVANGERQVIVNADGLNEERSYTVSLGGDYRPASLNGSVLSSVQVYYTILQDSFDTRDTGATDLSGRRVFERYNTDGSTIYGVEWDVAWQVDDAWSINAGVAYSHARFDEAVEVFAGNGVFSDKYNKTPDWSGLIALNYRNPDFVDVYAAMKWTGQMQVQRFTDAAAEEGELRLSDDFFVLDLGVSKTFEFERGIALTLRGGVNNVLNQYQDDFDTGAERDVGYVYGPRMPRTYTLGAKLDF